MSPAGLHRREGSLRTPVPGLLHHTDFPLEWLPESPLPLLRSCRVLPPEGLLPVLRQLLHRLSCLPLPLPLSALSPDQLRHCLLSAQSAQTLLSPGLFPALCLLSLSLLLFHRSEVSAAHLSGFRTLLIRFSPDPVLRLACPGCFLLPDPFRLYLRWFLFPIQRYLCLCLSLFWSPLSPGPVLSQDLLSPECFLYLSCLYRFRLSPVPSPYRFRLSPDLSPCRLRPSPDLSPYRFPFYPDRSACLSGIQHFLCCLHRTPSRSCPFLRKQRYLLCSLPCPCQLSCCLYFLLGHYFCRRFYLHQCLHLLYPPVLSLVLLLSHCFRTYHFLWVLYCQPPRFPGCFPLSYLFPDLLYSEVFYYPDPDFLCCLLQKAAYWIPDLPGCCPGMVLLESVHSDCSGPGKIPAADFPVPAVPESVCFRCPGCLCLYRYCLFRLQDSPVCLLWTPPVSCLLHLCSVYLPVFYPLYLSSLYLLVFSLLCRSALFLRSSYPLSPEHRIQMHRCQALQRKYLHPKR